MIKKTMKNSTLESVKKDELLANLNLFVDPGFEEPVADILTRAFQSDDSLDVGELAVRCSALDFPGSLNVQVGTVLFFLSTELM